MIKKKPNITNSKKINNNNPKINNNVSSIINTNKLPVKIIQTGKISISNNKENDTFSKSKDNKKCRRSCCKVLKIIGIILFFILSVIFSFCFFIGIFICMLFNCQVRVDFFIANKCCGDCKDDDYYCNCNCMCKCLFCFKRKKRIGTS